MNTSFNTGSATIYQFPLGGRASLGSRSTDQSPTDSNSPRLSEVAFGSGWYHDAAIQDAKPARDY